ncbi:MAG TPA: carboxypeptidase regulatory-like domain-containing protein [Bryobacteraceae bacterium]|nr:carboxypeptidase regulatory-like domain-containing protein [Bryobacteraceae bacterium]
MNGSEVQVRTRSGFLLILAVALLVALAQIGFAQESSAITGKVSDPSGAAVAGATVTARDVDRGTVWPTKTNDEGIYSIPRLPIGKYEVRVEAQGFQTALRPAFDLELNQTARVDITMTIGSVSSTVEVSAAAPLLQTETTQVGTTMMASSIASLPLETGNYNQLALLVPGAVTISPASMSGPQSTFNSARPEINGNREQANNYILDGMDNNEFVDNNVAYSPSVEALAEMNIITSSPSAEYGQFMGGVINATTKSGTNQMHGSGYWSFRRDALNANDWSRNFNPDPSVNSEPVKQKWDLFGATIGGPIKKDKLFFFADYQGSRFDLPPTSTTITTFTAAERTGNFTDLGVALNYPGTTVPMPANLTQATVCGPGQKMGSAPCITGISPTALKIMAALPQATGSGLLNNAQNTQSTYTHGDQGDFKLDWRPTDKDAVFARYTQQHVENPTSNSQALLYNSGGNNIFPIYNDVVGYTRTFSPSVVNDLRFGINYFPAEGNVQSAGSNAGAGLIPGQPTAFLPGLYFSNAPIGGGNGGPFPFGTTDSAEIFHQTTGQISDTLSWTRGAHTILFGAQILRYRNDYIPATSNDGAAGQIGFTGQYSGNAEVDFALGLPQYMGYGEGFSGTVGQRNSSYGLFAQDNWRVNSHLSVNIGLRWQVFTPIYEVHNRMTNFGMYSGQIELAGVDGNSRALYNQYNGIANFLPRLGLAWTPWGTSTVVRAAFSRSSFQEGTGEYNRLATNAPWNIDLADQFTAGANGAIPSNQVTLDQGFAALGAAIGGTPCNTTTVLSAPASCFTGVRIHMTDPNYRPGISNDWNVTVQHQFGNSTTVQAGYVGQHSDHMADIFFAGQKVLNPNGTTSPSPYLGGNAALTGDGLGQVRLNATTGLQNYQALQLSAQQRFAHGLAFGLNYSYQKCLTNAQGYYGRYGDLLGSQATADVAFQLYAYNMGLEYGLCDRDVTQVFNGYVNYNLPFGHGQSLKTNNKVADAIISDWQVNAIFDVHGGFPISMLDWGGDGGTGSAQGRPDCIAPSRETPYQNAPASVGGGYIWFDTSTMRDPAAGKLGDCGVSTEWGPGLKNIDLGLTRIFNITERQKLEFRFQAINAFNTPILDVTGYGIDVFSNGSLLGPNGGACTSASQTCTPNPNSTTGLVNTSSNARNLQFGLKYTF